MQKTLRPEDSAEAKAQLKQARKAVVAASIGNGLEWFDLVVYGTFALTIAKLFFPAEDAGASLLLTFATFGVSFLMRPLGAIIIGAYSDKAGRKAGLTLSIAIMFLGTLIIVLAPTAETIGITASILILLARLLQGFSAGGEFGSSTAFLIEYAPERKAFYGSFQAATQGAAILLAGLFGFFLHTYLSEQALESWGWRVPFIFALLIGPVGWYIRSNMEDTPEFLESGPSEAPLAEAFKTTSGPMVVIAGVVAFASVSNYLALYMPTYAITNLKMDDSAAFISTVIFGLMLAIASPYFGHLSDRIGPAKIMLIAGATSVVLAVPMFMLLIARPSLGTIVFIEIVFGLLATAYFAPLPALMAAVFPPQIRTTGISLAYNIAVMIFGGFTPFIMTWLTANIESLLSPAFYLALVALLSSICLVVVRRRYQQD